MTDRHGERPPTPVSEPAPVITEKARTADWVLDRRQGGAPVRHMDEPAHTMSSQGLAKGRDVWMLVANANANANATRRGVDEPAPTITGGHDSGGRRWLRSGQTVAGEGKAERPVSAPPSLTVISRFDLCTWVAARPATTVNGDPRISEPGHHDPDTSGSQQANAIRVTLEEALVLQSFPARYPVQGTRTKQYQQVGNAIPPLMAWHILRSIPGVPAVDVDEAAA